MVVVSQCRARWATSLLNPMAKTQACRVVGPGDCPPTIRAPTPKSDAATQRQGTHTRLLEVSGDRGD